MRPLTWRSPKALVPVLNQPLLKHLLLHLKSHSFTNITLAMTNQNQEIRDLFRDGSALGIKLDYAYEDIPLGSGGAIASIAQSWKEPFLVTNGDIITDIDLSAMFTFHRQQKAELTMHLHEVNDPSQFGVAVADADGRIRHFVEKPQPGSAPSKLINAGNWLFDPSVIKEISSRRFNRVEDLLFPAMCEAQRPIYGFSQPSYWRDVGNTDSLLRVNLELVNGSVSEAVPSGTEGLLIGKHVSIAKGVRLGKPTVIGSRSKIGASTEVARSVLWEQVSLDRNVVVRDSVLASHVTVAAGAMIDRSIIAHNARIESGAVIINEQIEPDSVIRAG